MFGEVIFLNFCVIVYSLTLILSCTRWSREKNYQYKLYQNITSRGGREKRIITTNNDINFDATRGSLWSQIINTNDIKNITFRLKPHTIDIVDRYGVLLIVLRVSCINSVIVTSMCFVKAYF